MSGVFVFPVVNCAGVNCAIWKLTVVNRLEFPFSGGELPSQW